MPLSWARNQTSAAGRARRDDAAIEICARSRRPAPSQRRPASRGTRSGAGSRDRIVGAARRREAEQDRELVTAAARKVQRVRAFRHGRHWRLIQALPLRRVLANRRRASGRSGRAPPVARAATRTAAAARLMILSAGQRSSSSRRTDCGRRDSGCHVVARSLTSRRVSVTVRRTILTRLARFASALRRRRPTLGGQVAEVDTRRGATPLLCAGRRPRGTRRALRPTNPRDTGLGVCADAASTPWRTKCASTVHSARDRPARFALAANLQQALGRLRQEIDDFQSVVPGRLEELLRDLGRRDRLPGLGGAQLAGALEPPAQGIGDPNGQGLLLGFVGHRDPPSFDMRCTINLNVSIHCCIVALGVLMSIQLGAASCEAGGEIASRSAVHRWHRRLRPAPAKVASSAVCAAATPANSARTASHCQRGGRGARPVGSHDPGVDREPRLAHLRLGRAIRVPADEVRRIIEQSTVPAERK